MNIAHLTASPFFGGPERQMLGLGLALPEECRSLYLSFAERGLARPFLEQLQRRGLEARALRHNFPRLPAAIAEVATELRDFGADILFCHGYKADVIGWRAARRLGIPVVAVARGWTGATWKVHCYEWLDRLCLFAMDAVVCVSDGQAAKVRRLGVPQKRVHVIRNAIDPSRFATIDPWARARLEAMLPHKPRWLIGAAGRFSPEKGFPDLIDAAAQVCRSVPDAAFVLFGDGPQRALLERKLTHYGLSDHVLLPGFSAQLDSVLPAFDLVVLPSHTEGLPNIALEACAARVAVVATAVGGTPEVVQDGVNGLLAPAAAPAVLAKKIEYLLCHDQQRRAMGVRGWKNVVAAFSFARQAREYQALATRLTPKWKHSSDLRETVKAA
jgi:glycosyltransferase involved in cell wall biosynthesis